MTEPNWTKYFALSERLVKLEGRVVHLEAALAPRARARRPRPTPLPAAEASPAVAALAGRIEVGVAWYSSDTYADHSGDLHALGVESVLWLGRVLAQHRGRTVALQDGSTVRLERSARTRRGYAWRVVLVG